MVNFKNINKAHKSTFIGIIIAAAIVITEQLSTGSVEWKGIATAAGVALLAALTNVLKEEKKKIDGGT